MFTGAKYARSGDVNIAYQVVGDGPIDLVLTFGWVSHLAYVWEQPAIARFLNRLASFTRLILYDKRGTGMSDRVHPVPTLEQRMDDVRAVMDATGSERAAVMGISEGGVMSTLFAATYPERTIGLIINGSYPSALRRPGYPWGNTEAEYREALARVKDVWGTHARMDRYAPSQVDNPEVTGWWKTFMQMSASPGDAQDLLAMNLQIDIGGILPSIRVPTLVIHATRDKVAPIEAGRYFAEHIPGARMLELDTEDHWFYFVHPDLVLGEIQEFLTGVRTAPAPDTMLATVLCTEVAQAGAHAGSSVTGAGTSSSTATTRSCGRRLRAITVARSRPASAASPRCSTAQPARSGARSTCAMSFSIWGCASAPESTPASARWRAGVLGGSPSTSRRA